MMKVVPLFVFCTLSLAPSIFAESSAVEVSGKNKGKALVDLPPGAKGLYRLSDCRRMTESLGSIPKPPSLRIDTTIRPFDEEFPAYGQLVVSPADLANLRDGITVVSVTADEDIMVSPRFVEVATDSRHFLTTHRSHLGQFKAMAPGKNVEIILGGEVEVRNKKVVAISDQSRTAKGQKPHLFYGAHQLLLKGLNADPEKTALLDLSDDPDAHLGPAHAKAFEAAMEEQVVMHDPQLLKMLALVRDVDSKLEKTIPHPHYLGHFDYFRLSDYILTERSMGNRRQALIEQLVGDAIERRLASLSFEIQEDIYDAEDVSALEARIAEYEALSERREVIRRRVRDVTAVDSVLNILHRDGPVKLVYQYRDKIPALQDALIIGQVYAEKLADTEPTEPAANPQ